MSRLLGPKVGNSIKCLSQGQSDALLHRESNQGFATFRLLAWRLYHLSYPAARCLTNQSIVPLVLGQVHCFSMQVVMNKCFLMNPEKNWRRSVLSFTKKRKNASLNPKNDVTEPKARLLQ